MQRLISTLMMLFVPAIVVACAPQTENTFRGQMLLWHSLDNETEQAVLDEVLGRFMDIYEDVNIITQAVPRDSLLERYRTAAESGLGPDLMIGESRWVQELAEDNLIRDLTPLEPRVDIYFSGAVASLRYTVEEESRIYGLPFALRPVALYYNTDLVTQPATTLDALLADAADGQRVAVDTRFINSYWGTPAFGGRLFDDSGRTVLDEGGFANWLTWLSSAQSSPGMFLSRDAAAILDLFQRERVAYMIATPDNLQMLKQTMGEEKISVALLPSGPVGEAGPLLRVDGLMLNASSSANQAELALLLARFLTNADQGGVFVRQSGIIPANRRVRIDEIAYPAAAGFRTQAQRAIPMPNLPQMTTLLQESDNLIIQVLEGVISEAEAARTITTVTNEMHGYEVEVAQSQDCELEGELVLWHSMEGRAESTLNLIADNYMGRCTQVAVELVFIPVSDEANPLDAYMAEVVAPPALLLGDAEWVDRLVAVSHVEPATTASVQTYLPETIQQLTRDDTLYGIPFAVSTIGLYYDRQQIETIATSLSELSAQTVEEDPVMAVPIGFETHYWGYRASGGTLINDANEFVFDSEAWLAWLTWLDMTSDSGHVLYSNNQNMLLEAFLNGDVAYYIGKPVDFIDIETVLGSDGFAITTLPAGTDGDPETLLDVQAFFVNNRTPASIEIAMDFSAFATDSSQQRILVETTGLIPANVNIVVEDTDSIRPWFEQVQNAVVLPALPEVDTLRTEGTPIMDSVARGTMTPREATIMLGELFDIPVSFDVDSDSMQVTEEATEEAE